MINSAIVVRNFFIVLALIFITFSLLRIPSIYESTISDISYNYANGPNGITINNEPFQYVSHEKVDFLAWDAWGYYNIKEGMYSIEESSNYAFFPLFPIIWNLSGLSPKYIVFLNYSLFVIGLLFIFSLFPNTSSLQTSINSALLLLLPLNVVYMVPYTEALFFVTLSIAFWGIVKKKPVVVFIAFFLNAATRPSGQILLMSMFVVDLVYILRTGFRTKCFIKDFLTRYLSIILGTTTVLILQKIQGSPEFFSFYTLQKEIWDLYLSWPKEFSDWSKESFSINYALVFIMVLPVLFYLVRSGLSVVVKKIDFPQYPEEDEDNSRMEFVVFLSAVFIFGMFLITFLYRHGSLNTLSRYTMCTPCFVFVVMALKKLADSDIIKPILAWLALFIISIYLLRFVPYSNAITFQWLGFGLVFFFVLLIILQRYIDTLLYKIGVGSYVFFAVIWQAYLLNMYICKGYIFL